jgi:hypothetical protein
MFRLEPSMTTKTRRALLASAAALALTAGCADPDFHGPPDDELEQVHMAVTCNASMSYYPIGGPHNGGYDSNALNYTCAGHPSSSPDNSDWIGGDHYGNDLFAALGTPAIAVTSGTISHSGYGSVSGNRITIRDDCGWHYFSGHLDTIAPGMTVGRYVNAGEVIGTVGNTGNASGTSPHIHFSVYPESYNSGIDPFPMLQAVDASACTGASSIAEGTTPDPLVNPCTDADIRAAEGTRDFALASGVADIFNELGRSDGTFLAQDSYGGGSPYTVGKWGPWISHTGLWEVDVRIPDTELQLTNSARYDIAFLGGHALVEVNQNANKGEWVELMEGQPFKFGVGPRGYVGLSNVLSVGTGGKVAFDEVRFRYVGPEGSTQVGGSCDLSNDCDGTLICGEFGTCEQPCNDSYCDTGVCDQGTGLCVEPGGDEGGSPTDWIAQFGDTDRDGIPNYLEGMDDTDGDGTPNWLDHDSDNDGIPDWNEGAGDADGDGVLDYADTDADGDGLPDADEVGDPDMPVDTDLDGTPDFLDLDADGDAIPDIFEIGHPEDPTDTDGDGLPNYRDVDSDGDGIRDDVEAGWTPEDPADFDEDGTPNHLDLDSDGDGLTDRFEGNDDSDSDGHPDYLDLDSDNDGIADADDADSDGDGRDDSLGWSDWDATDREPLAPQNACSSAGPADIGWLALLFPIGAAFRRRE